MKPAVLWVLALVGAATVYATIHSSPGTQDRLEVPPPPFSDGIFPCSDCHADLEVNRTRRDLVDMHDDIVLQHDEDNRWCLDCHYA